MRKKQIFIALGIIFLTIFLRLPYAYIRILNPDEANYTIIAREVLKGKTIYKDIVDTRPPLGYLLYMLVEIIGNKKNTLFGIHLLTIAWVILTILILIHIGNRILGNNIGFITGFLYSVFSMGYYCMDVVAANAEIFMIFPLVLSFLFFSYYLFEKKKIYCFLSAFMVGISFLFKQMGIYNIFPVFLVSLYLLLEEKKKNLHDKFSYLFNRQTIVLLSIVGIGFLLPFFITLVYFLFKNSLSSYIYSNFIIGYNYVKAVTLKSGLYTNYAMTKQLIIHNFVLFGLALCGVIKIFLRIKVWKNKNVEYEAFILFLFLQTIFSFFGAYTGKRPFGHYYLPIFPSVALLAGYGFKTIQEIIQEKIFIKKRLYFLLKLFCGLIIILGMYKSFTAFHDLRFFGQLWRNILKSHFLVNYEEDEIVLYVKKNSTEKDKIFVWGYYPEFYVCSNRSPASRFFTSTLAIGILPGDEKIIYSQEDIEKFRYNLVEDFSKNLPVYIIDTTQNLHKSLGYNEFPLEKISIVWQFVKDRYYLEKEIMGVKIYRRNDKI